ncbi:uncharacterized protein LOC111277184 isoform X2 [Durio zibethinus]|uniref:Uncharacterized protein LOC111277184 isoform X2 n=2 Tax=Durio zibethinus TaxID=66656 RepID=A0A6P5WSQ7_DURZI|nr:uncharacterized protein LOC111277184 isoform X2 [Durio zibethinus]
MRVLDTECLVLLNLITRSRLCCVLLDDHVSKLQKGKENRQYSIDNIVRMICLLTRALLTSATYVHLKHADVFKYTRSLSPASQAILLSRPAELYHQMLAKALAHYFESKLLLLDVTDFSLKIQSKYGSGKKSISTSGKRKMVYCHDASYMPAAKRQQKRWRSVFAAIYLSMTLVSLYMKVINKKQILRTLSCIALDIHDNNSGDDHLPSLCVHQNTLTEVVSETNLEKLSKLGGVKQIAASLATDEKDGISANQADLACRIAVYGVNSYQNHLPKASVIFYLKLLRIQQLCTLGLCYK